MLLGKEVQVEELEWLRGRTEQHCMSTVSGSLADVGQCSDPRLLLKLLWTVLQFLMQELLSDLLSHHTAAQTVSALFCHRSFSVLKCMEKDFHYGSLVGWASVFALNLLQLRKPLDLFSNPLGFINSSLFDFQPDTQFRAKS